MNPFRYASVKSFCLLFASLAVGFILIELALRLLGWSHPIFMRPDPKLGWAFRAGVAGWSTQEDTAYLSVNRFGFRDREWSVAPGEGVLRIAMLGDSFVESSNLPAALGLTGLLERELDSDCRATKGKKVEVLNFGVSGYGTAQQYLQLVDDVIKFEPHIVLLGFYAGNDVANNSRVLSADSQRNKPYFEVSAAGELRRNDDFRSDPGFVAAIRSDWRRAVVNRSYVLQAMKQVALGRPVVPVPLAYDPFVGDSPPPSIQPENPGNFAPPADPIWANAWAATESLILRSSDFARRNRIEFGVAIFPEPAQVLPSREWRAAVARGLGVDGLDYTTDRLMAFLGRHDVPRVDLLAPLRATADADRIFLYGFPPRRGDGHLNQFGKKAAAAHIARWVCAAFE